MCGEEIRNVLAENIKLLRAQQKLSQADLAYKAEISIPFLSSIERGTKWPYPETLAKLSTALGTSVSSLFLQGSEQSELDKNTISVTLIEKILTAQQKAVENVCKEYFSGK